VPGPVDSPASAGCLELIRNGARLIRSADDVIEDLQGLAANQGTGDRGQETGVRKQETEKRGQETGVRSQETPEVAAPRIPELTPTEQRVFDALASRRHADELTRELALSVGELSRTLMLLELKKVVRRLPGNFYERR
jgi:DNA processing protein